MSDYVTDKAAAIVQAMKPREINTKKRSGDCSGSGKTWVRVNDHICGVFEVCVGEEGEQRKGEGHKNDIRTRLNPTPGREAQHDGNRMQRCWAVAAVESPLVAAVISAVLLYAGAAISDPLQQTLPETAAAGSSCDLGSEVVYQGGQTPETRPACGSNMEIQTQDRAYLIETSAAGTTMMRQGLELAIDRLHPEFVRRLAVAIREARAEGLSSTGISSAYRPPAFGVGGFADKFNSLHTYGLVVDMSGIGGPGSTEAKHWYEIAARHGVSCPYGVENRAEWNHCQPTRVRIVVPESPLRGTVTANGPIDLGSMFQAGNALIESPESVAGAENADAIRSAGAGAAAMAGNRVGEQIAAAEDAIATFRQLRKRISAARTARAWRSEPPRSCGHPHQRRKETCGGSGRVETVAVRGPHPRQASVSSQRHHT
jgi:hypothetical protein